MQTLTINRTHRSPLTRTAPLIRAVIFRRELVAVGRNDGDEEMWRIGLAPGQWDDYTIDAETAAPEPTGPRAGDVLTVPGQIDALPEGAVVIDRQGSAWQYGANTERWYCTYLTSSCGSPRLLANYGPITLAWLPKEA